MKQERVFIERDCLEVILASAIEVFPRETNGLLMGGRLVKKVRGRSIGIFTLRMSYPVQTAERKPSYVEHGNIAAVERLLKSLCAMGKNIAGGYHSHPEPRPHTRLTKSDMDFIGDEMKRYRDCKGFRGWRKWIELVISVKKRGYKKRVRPRESLALEGGRIVAFLKSRGYTGYELKIGGYAVERVRGILKKSRVGLVFEK